MSLSPRRLQILKLLDRLTRHGEVPITDAARAIGGGFSGTQGRIYELIRLGYLQKHKQEGQFAHVSVSEKGRAAIAGKEPGELSDTAAENDRSILGRRYLPPHQKISDEERRAAYSGARRIAARATRITRAVKSSITCRSRVRRRSKATAAARLHDAG